MEVPERPALVGVNRTQRAPHTPPSTRDEPRPFVPPQFVTLCESRISLRDLPTGDEFQFDLRFARGDVERRLTHTGRRRCAIGVEQFQNAALAGFVTDA